MASLRRLALAFRLEALSFTSQIVRRLFMSLILGMHKVTGPLTLALASSQ